MKSVQTGEQNKIDVVDIELPVPGPKDALVRIRACGICGTDVQFLHMGGIPFGPGGSMISLPLGHEPAGEIVAVGSEVTGLKTGDRVVVNPQGAPLRDHRLRRQARRHARIPAHRGRRRGQEPRRLPRHRPLRRRRPE